MAAAVSPKITKILPRTVTASLFAPCTGAALPPPMYGRSTAAPQTPSPKPSLPTSSFSRVPHPQLSEGAGLDSTSPASFHRPPTQKNAHPSPQLLPSNPHSEIFRNPLTNPTQVTRFSNQEGTTQLLYPNTKSQSETLIQFDRHPPRIIRTHLPKSTAVVFPPQTNTPTLSPFAATYLPDNTADIAAAPPGSLATRITLHNVLCASRIASSVPT